MEMQESGKGHGLISKMIEYVKCESKKGLTLRLNYVRPDEFCALTYRNVTPQFENLKYRRIPYNMIIKVTEFID